ncbi:SMI1/KNR4 family protein [Oceanobacter mangrovi]|uniref:SMI1/KNR4 family protein n=1 Tax=Oceanobacter mangrovi TaxID=2862510 RepID=UPI001C8E0C82|nr:SMI1/KNR4 family protein [Oceanobacter mangrovi]
MPELIDCEAQLTRDDIAALEAQLIARLPESLSQHYLQANGGEPSEQDREAGLWGWPLNSFNPIRHGHQTAESLMRDLADDMKFDDEERQWQLGEFLPFACDDGGNPLFVSLLADDYGAVYVAAPYDGVLQRLADSFAAFRARLFRIEVE